MHLKKANLLALFPDKEAAAFHHYDKIIENDPYNAEALVGKAKLRIYTHNKQSGYFIKT
jgi:hypothetical protein